MGDVIATNAAPGDDLLTQIMGIDPAKIAAGVQNLTNNIAALSAQNDDIAHSRFTLNNIVYQFNQLQPAVQVALVAGLAWVILNLVRH